MGGSTLGMYHREKTVGQTQNMLRGLHFPAGLGMLWGPPGVAGILAVEKDVWVAYYFRQGPKYELKWIRILEILGLGSTKRIALLTMTSTGTDATMHL